MNLLKDIKNLVVQSAGDLQKSGEIAADVNLSDIIVEIPPVSDFGHLATNAAMVIAKQLKTNPRSIADLIARALKASDKIADVSIAGPGFINITLKDSVWDNSAAEVLKSGNKYGNSDFGKGEKVNVEFLSANPTGPIHVGHTRGAIFGNALSELLKKVGYSVTKEYYINDYGVQIETLANSVYWRYEELFGLHKDESITEGFYPGDYIIPVAQEIKDEYGNKFIGQPREIWADHFNKTAVSRMMDSIRSDLAKLDVYFDVFTSERNLVESGKVDAAIAKMNTMGLLYKGTLAQPLGEGDSEPDPDWKPEIQTLFRSSKFGDTSDRVVLRADDSKTYLASDIAYHFDKFQRGFNKMIDVWGADHGGYVPRLKAAVTAITGGKGEVETELVQMVNLLKDGKPFRMSKRAGNFVLVSDILEEIDANVLKVFMLSRTPETQMSFDLARTSEQSKDNPIYYIQYAFGRMNSVLNNYKNTFGTEFTNNEIATDFYKNLTPAEQEIIRDVAFFPQLIESAALKKAPNLVVGYLEKLSQKFHSIWTMGAKSGDKFINADEPLKTNNKMLMIKIIKTTIQSGLNALGIEAIQSLERK